MVWTQVWTGLDQQASSILPIVEAWAYGEQTSKTLSIMDPNASKCSQISFSGRNESFAFNAPSSTPFKSRKRNSQVLKSLHSRWKTPVATCEDCGKTYLSQRHYQNHIRLHANEKSYCHRPSVEDILSNVPAIDIQILQKCSLNIAFGPKGKEYLDLVSSIMDAAGDNDSWAAYRRSVFQHLAACTQKSQFILPSQLMLPLIYSSQELLTCMDTRDEFEYLVKDIQPKCSPETIQIFICDYVMTAIQSLPKFISFRIKKDYLSTAKIIQFDQEDEEIISYCAASILNGFLKMGRRYPRNPVWQRTVKCIKSKLLECEDGTEAALYQKRWTESIGRGALKKINAKAMEFFICVAKCCTQCEGVHGSLPYDVVLETVMKNGIAATWDDIISDFLPSRESLSLMYGLVKSFSRTCGHSIAKRRFNIPLMPTQQTCSGHQD